MIKYFDFEKEIEKIDKNILLIDKSKTENYEKIKLLNEQKQNKLNKIYSSLNPWQKVQVARHESRPHSIDYINHIFEEFIPLHGDKKFAEDYAVIGGIAKIENKSVGNDKGKLRNVANTKLQKL